MKSVEYLDEAKTFTQHDFGLDRRLVKACAKAGFIYPTLVQSKCIPLALQGKDLLVRARTGSGKTAAYALPLLQKILAGKESNPNYIPAVRAIILVPTRELCAQVKMQLWELMSYCQNTVSLAAIYGDNKNAEKAQIRNKPDIIVATPSRLVALLNEGMIKLKETVETLVVDEADLVLSFGYKDDIKSITMHLPKICQGLLMSATLSPELEDLKRVILHSPVVVKLEEGATDGKLVQFYLALPQNSDKNLIVYAFLKLGLLEGKGLFFVNSTDSCYQLKIFLELFHIRSAVLNSELPFSSRMHIIEEFNHGVFDYLIATDESMDTLHASTEDDEIDEVKEEEKDDTLCKDSNKKGSRKKRALNSDSEYGVSRGVDFRGVKFVFNVDFPPSVKSYTHRIGRTSRGGANGTALSLVCTNSAQDMDLLSQVQASQPALPSLSSDTIISSMGVASNNEQGDYGMLQLNRAQPAPLSFDIGDIDQFRYRVDDVSRKVSKGKIKAARLAEFRKELVNCKELDSYFKENPDDLKVLRHDSTLVRPRFKQDHLKFIPKYLMPPGMITGEDPTVRQGRYKRKKLSKSTMDRKFKGKNKDPLRTFKSKGNKRTKV